MRNKLTIFLAGIAYTVFFFGIGSFWGVADYKKNLTKKADYIVSDSTKTVWVFKNE